MANNNNEVRISFRAQTQEFNKAMTEMNKETTALRQQMKLQQEQMKHNATDSEKLEAKMDSLQQIYEVARKKTEATARQLEEAKALWGENSEEAKKYAKQLLSNKIAEEQAANAITDTQKALQRAQQAQEDQNQSLKNLNNLFTVTGKSVSDFSSLLGRDLTRAIQNGTASTNQLDQAFNKITQATQGTSANIEQVRQVLSRLDDGSSVESVQSDLRALNSVSRTTADEIKQLQQAMRLKQEEMKHTATESEKLESKLLGLESVYMAMRRETRETANQLRDARAAYGENSKEAKQLEEQLQRNRIAQQQMSNEITDTREAIQKQNDSFGQLKSLLQVTEKSVDDFASVIGTDLVSAINSGKASAQDLDRAFSLISRSALGAETDIQQIQQTLRTLDSGSSIEDVRRDLERLQQEAQQTEDSVESLGDKFQALGGVIAGVGLAGVATTALESASLETKIDVSFNVPPEAIASVKEAVRSVEKYGIDGEEALEGVRRQWALNKDASDESNAAIVEGAGVIARSYQGIDFMELIQETNEFAAALEISNEEALAMTNSLLKFGFPPEQLDTLAEYGLQMKQIGFSSAEIQSIFEKGVDLKSWNVDNLNDGVKEANLQMRTFGNEVPKALEDLLSRTDVSSKQMQAWGKAVASGGKEGATAMGEVSDWLQTIEDDALRNELAIQVFGTKAEDQGDNMIKIFQGLADAQDKTVENQEGLNEAIEKTNSDAMVQLKEAIGNMITALDPLLSVIASVIGAMAGWAAEHPVITGAIVALVSTIGILIGIFAALGPALLGVVALFGEGGFAAVLGKIIPVITNLSTKILPALRVAFGALTGPLGIAITALTIAVPLIIEHWDKIVDFFKLLWDGILTIFKTVGTAIWEFVKKNWEWILAAITGPVGLAVKIVKDNWDKIKKFTDFSALWQKTKDVWDKISTAIMSPINKAKDAVKKAIDAIKGFFKFDFNWPKLKVPKFKITGSINPLDWFGKGLPKIDIQWHKAGGVFDKPTLFNTGNALHGVGEAGPEAILPLNERVLGAIGRAIFDASDGGSGQTVNHYNYQGMLDGAVFHIREDADVDKLARKLLEKQQRDIKGR